MKIWWEDPDDGLCSGQVLLVAGPVGEVAVVRRPGALETFDVFPDELWGMSDDYARLTEPLDYADCVPEPLE